MSNLVSLKKLKYPEKTFNELYDTLGNKEEISHRSVDIFLNQCLSVLSQ